jgi:hypothetical protein
MQGAATVNGPPVVLLLPGRKADASNVIADGAGLPTLAPFDICTMVRRRCLSLCTLAAASATAAAAVACALDRLVPPLA